MSKDLQPRTQRLLDLGILERAGSKRLMLSRRYYEFVDQKGTYTRKKGLDREQNLALLLKHIIGLRQTKDDAITRGSRVYQR